VITANNQMTMINMLPKTKIFYKWLFCRAWHPFLHSFKNVSFPYRLRGYYALWFIFWFCII